MNAVHSLRRLAGDLSQSLSPVRCLCDRPVETLYFLRAGVDPNFPRAAVDQQSVSVANRLQRSPHGHDNGNPEGPGQDDQLALGGTQVSGILLDVPADILKNAMIGYKLYFDPETTPTTDRFGPLGSSVHETSSFATTSSITD